MGWVGGRGKGDGSRGKGRSWELPRVGTNVVAAVTAVVTEYSPVAMEVVTLIAVPMLGMCFFLKALLGGGGVWFPLRRSLM